MNWHICLTYCGVNLLFWNSYIPEFSDPQNPEKVRPHSSNSFSAKNRQGTDCMTDKRCNGVFPTVITLLTFRFICLKNNITWQNKLLWKIVQQLHSSYQKTPTSLSLSREEGNGTEGDRSERWGKKSGSWEKYPPVPSTSAGTNKKENASGGGRNWVKN